MSIPYQVVDFPFVGALDESVEPKLLSDGFTQVINGKFDKSGKIEKRPGLSLVDNTGLTYIERLIVDNDRLIGVGEVSNATPTDMSAQLGNSIAGVGEWHTLDRISEATIRRESIAKDAAIDITDCNIGWGGGWTFYVWEAENFGAGDLEVHLRIQNSATGTIASEQTVATIAGVSAANPTAVKDADVSMLVAWYDQSTDTTYFRIYNVSNGANPPSLAFSFTRTGVKLDARHIIPRDTTGWWFCYIDANDDVHVDTITTAGSVSTLFTVSGTMQSPAIGLIGTTKLMVVYRDTAAAELRADVWTLGGAHDAGPFTISTAATTSAPSIVNYSAASTALISWTTTGGGDIARVLQWKTCTTTGTVSSLFQTARLKGVSKLFRTNHQGGGLRFYQWVKSEEGSIYIGRETLHLVELNTSTGWLARPLCVAAYGISSSVGAFNLSEVALESTASTSYTFRMGCRVTILPGTDVQGFDEIITRFDHPNRWAWVKYGPVTYVASGLLQQICKKFIDENGFIQAPRIKAADAAGTGLEAGDYQYCLVYEYVDDANQVHKSPPSVVWNVTVTDHGGGQGTADLTIHPLTLTRRQRGDRADPPVMLVPYRTEKGPGEIFYRLYAADSHPTALLNDPSDTTTVSQNDSVSDATLTTHERLYTTAELERDSVYGGGTCLCVHKNRLFVAGGEQKDSIWYSQEFVNTLPAAFNLATQIQIPGEDIQQLASLDDALIVWTLDKIFAVYGEGPDATGDPASGFYANPQLITAETGLPAGQQRSLVQTSKGWYFRGKQGIYLLGHGRGVQLVSNQVDDTLAAYPTTTSATFTPDTGEIRWTLTTSPVTVSTTVVYNETFDRWATWPHLSAAKLFDAAYVSGAWYAATSASIYKENATYLDANAGYALSVKTGQMSFATWQTQKRVRRARAIIRDEGSAGGLKLKLYLNGSDSVTETHSWTSTAIAALTMDAVRAHIKHQKGSRYQWELVEDPVPTGQGLSFIGLSFEVGIEGNIQRQAAADTR